MNTGGEKLPQLKTKTLAGRTIVFPDDLAGKYVFIVFATEDNGHYQSSQAEADKWKSLWLSGFSESCDFYEVPLMSKAWRILSPMIDSGMRSGIAPELHDNVACYYGDKNGYLASLGMEGLRKGHAVLINDKGEILFKKSGVPDKDDLAQIRNLLLIEDEG